MQTFEVQGYWDNVTQVWWAESDDVIGLVAESRSHDALIIELRQLLPELLTFLDRSNQYFAAYMKN